MNKKFRIEIGDPSQFKPVPQAPKAPMSKAEAFSRCFDSACFVAVFLGGLWFVNKTLNPKKK